MELIRPQRAATGLMYLRTRDSYLSWYKAHRDASAKQTLHPPAHRDIFSLCLHHVKGERKGKYSPKTAYFAMKYFADRFGFSDEPITYRRSKKLVDMSSKPEGPRNLHWTSWCGGGYSCYWEVAPMLSNFHEVG